MRRARRSQLRKMCRLYIGELVRQVVNTYEAFDELPDDERDFVDQYIREFGERVIEGGHG